jgi:DNA-directed RNA polymerase specialized sigma24 family protein
VGINLANSYYRRRIAERKANARAAAGSALPDPGPDLETASAIRSAVSSLPRRQRTALVMRYYLDLPVRDVARHMDCSEGTVKALTSQAVSGLRRHPQIIDLGDLSNV